MSMFIFSNSAASIAELNLNNAQGAVTANISHLSSGLRIDSPGDDPAGLGISKLFNAQVQSYSQADRNTNDGISLLQTTDGALSQIQSSLTRMRELAVESANGTYGASDRSNITVELTNLQSEIDRIAGSTYFANVQILNAPQTVTLQVGVNNTANDQINVVTAAAGTTALGVNAVKVDTQTNAQNALTSIDSALSAISAQRANLGALSNRLSVASSNDETFGVNLSAAMGRIQDVDVASESGDLARNQVLTQAGVAVLAQANQIPDLSLKLLQ